MYPDASHRRRGGKLDGPERRRPPDDETGGFRYGKGALIFADRDPNASLRRPRLGNPIQELRDKNLADSTVFRIEVDKEGLPEDTVRLIVRGNLTSAVSSQLKNEVNRLIARGYKNFQIDMTDLLYLDSTGLSAFVAGHKQVAEISGTFKLVNPRRLIRHLFVSAKLDSVLDIGPAAA